MLVASINLNKRLGADRARERLTAWLMERCVRVVLAQEPFKPVERTAPPLPGFTLVGGDGRLAVWIGEELARPRVSSPYPWAQRVDLDWLTVLQVHLDADAASSRVRQLGALKGITDSEKRPLLVCGDFNLAPRPEDGLFGDRSSEFTTRAERRAVRLLIEGSGLVDATATARPAFTVERWINGLSSRFRCDLALISDHLAPTVTVSADDSVRRGPTAFTDHSALLIDLPVTPEPAGSADTLFDLTALRGATADTGLKHNPHLTAMSRRGPSPAARAVTRHLLHSLKATSVLDHGCGHGADVHYYRAHGAVADGFDPYPGFGWARPQGKRYDLVTSLFVLNVLPDPWQRIQALVDAASFVADGGHLMVVTRSPEEIAAAAVNGGWKSHNDGFWSSERKGTFQRGVGAGEIAALARRAGLEPARGVPALPLAGVCHAILAKQGS